MRKRYLFIRILEACNANCFMCDFALSRDRYRFGVEEFRSLLPEALTLGVRFARFTGGEPLMHRDILGLISAGAKAGLGMGVITNGAALGPMAQALAEAGLNQVIVSIDGATAATHDDYRQTPGLFDRCIKGLRAAREAGLRTRVNTVVGPYNYAEMGGLQRLLTSLKVGQWELSAIKLERHIPYTDPEDVRAACESLYNSESGRLVPLGKRFFGDTEPERQRFFDEGVMPRAGAPRCHLMGDVIYIDAKGGRGFGCSLLPHRGDSESGGGAVMRQADGSWKIGVPDFDAHVAHFQESGPSVCRGCSTTAAAYSDTVASGITPGDWQF